MFRILSVACVALALMLMANTAEAGRRGGGGCSSGGCSTGGGGCNVGGSSGCNIGQSNTSASQRDLQQSPALSIPAPAVTAKKRADAAIAQAKRTPKYDLAKCEKLAGAVDAVEPTGSRLEMLAQR